MSAKHQCHNEMKQKLKVFPAVRLVQEFLEEKQPYFALQLPTALADEAYAELDLRSLLACEGWWKDCDTQ